MKKADLKKIVDKAKVTVRDDYDDRDDSFVVDLTKDFNRTIEITAKDESEARKLALELIIDEPDSIRGFSLEDV